MPDEALTQALSRALLALRITLGLFLLQWGVEKFVVPQNTVAIWGYFYGLNVPQALAYLFGAVEIAIAGCLFLGLFRTAAYGAALALHAVSVLVSWRQLLDPWGDPANHLFVAGIPVLGALIALFPAAALGPRPPGGASGPAIRLIVSQAGCGRCSGDT
jgi:putative oxidoreductase